MNTQKGREIFRILIDFPKKTKDIQIRRISENHYYATNAESVKSKYASSITYVSISRDEVIE